MPTVWAVHDVRDDISPALGFGPIRFINQRYINGDELDKDPLGWTIPAAFDRHIREAALEFKAADDYLLIAGDHLQLLAFMAALLVWNNSICVLRYDRRMGEYIPVWVHSSIAPAPAPVLGSNHIGDDHEQSPQSRNQDATTAQTVREAVHSLEHPLTRYIIPTPQRQGD